MTKTSADYRTKTWHGIQESKCEIYLGSFSKSQTGKICDLSFRRKGCFCGYANILYFQLFGTAILIKKKFAEGNIQVLFA